jgi:hypothetical protein
LQVEIRLPLADVDGGQNLAAVTEPKSDLKAVAEAHAHADAVETSSSRSE